MRRPSLRHRCPICGSQLNGPRQKINCMERHVVNLDRHYYAMGKDAAKAKANLDALERKEK